MTGLFKAPVFADDEPEVVVPVVRRPIVSTNGHRPVAVKPEAGPALENSIDSLLAAAEESGITAALKLAGQIRDLVARLVQEIHDWQKDKDMREHIADLRRQLDEALQEYQDVKGKQPRIQSAQTNKRDRAGYADHFGARGNQSAIRAWAVDNGYEVKSSGSISKSLREAYEKAMGES